MSTRLYRSEEDRILGGVCGGIAEVYDMDPTLVRIVTLLIVLGPAGGGLLVYLIAWLIVPTESEVKGRNEKKSVSEESSSSEEESDSGEEAFECDECGREFDSERGLSVHKGQKHKE